MGEQNNSHIDKKDVSTGTHVTDIDQHTVDRLEEAYAFVSDVQLKSLTGNLDDISVEDAKRYQQMREQLDLELWQFAINRNDVLVDYVDPNTDKVVLAFDIVTADIPRPPQIMRNEQTRNEVLIERFIDGSKELKGFSVNDAMALVTGEDAAADVRARFKNADQDVLMAAAYILLDAKKDEIPALNHDFAEQHQETDFLDMASVNIFYRSQSAGGYDTWNYDRQDRFVQAVIANETIISLLEQIKSPVNIHSRTDIEQQYVIRAQLTELLADEYATAYDLNGFGSEDMFFAHKSIADYIEDTQIAAAYSSTVGTENDEAILVTYHPIADMIRTHESKGGMGLTDESSRNAFLKTTIEELQHTADNIYGDRLLSGRLSANHPAYAHTSLYLLNTMHYVNTGEVGQSNYEAQHLERTAKTSADEITFEIMFQMNQPREDTPTESMAKKPTQDTELNTLHPSGKAGLTI